MLDAILKNIILPEVTRLIREHFAATGELLTDEQVFERLQAHADDVVAKGEAFLKSKGQ